MSNSKELKVKYHGKKDKPVRKKNPNVASISKLGYRDDSPYNTLPYIDIDTPNGRIDMSGTGIPLWANGRILPPYSGIHQFDTTQVKEIPLAQKGKNTTAQRDATNVNVIRPDFNANPILGLKSDPNVVKYLETQKDKNWGDPYDFLMNWYAAPETQRRLAAQKAPTDVMPAALNQKRFNEVLDWYFYKKDQNRKDAEDIWGNVNPISEPESYKYKQELISVLNEKLERQYENIRDDTWGFHIPKDSVVVLNSGNEDDLREQNNWTAVHELTHATGLDDFYNKYFEENKPKKVLDPKTWTYFDEKLDEIYPRIQELRYRMRKDGILAPGIKVTPDMLKDYPNPKSYDLRNYYTDEELAKIMNEVAYAPQENNGLPLAQTGTEFYNRQRAIDLGYQPNEEGHWPSADYETGEWLKSKEHDTAWKEYLYGYTLNPQQALNYNVQVNPEGYFGENTLQYVPNYQGIGPYPEMGEGGSKLPPHLPEAYKTGGWLDEYQTGGTTIRQIWEATTGKDWSQAKKEGLTDGSYEANKALEKKLRAGDFGKVKIPGAKPAAPAPVVNARPASVVAPASPLYMQALKQANSSSRPSSLNTNVPVTATMRRDIDTGKVAANKKAAEEARAKEIASGKGKEKMFGLFDIPVTYSGIERQNAETLGKKKLAAETVQGDVYQNLLEAGSMLAGTGALSKGSLAGKAVTAPSEMVVKEVAKKVNPNKGKVIKTETDLPGGLKMIDYSGKRNRSNMVAKVYDPANPNNLDNYVELRFSPETNSYYMSASMSGDRRKAGLAFMNLEKFYGKNAPKGSIFGEPPTMATPGYKLSTRKPTASADSYYLNVRKLGNKEGYSPMIEDKMIFNSSGTNNPMGLEQIGAHSKIGEWPPLLRYTDESSAMADAAKANEFLKSQGITGEALVKMSGSKNNPSYIIEAPNIKNVKNFLRGGNMKKSWLAQYQKAGQTNKILIRPGMYADVYEGMTPEETIEQFKLNSDYFGDVSQNELDKRYLDYYNKYTGKIKNETNADQAFDIGLKGQFPGYMRSDLIERVSGRNASNFSPVYKAPNPYVTPMPVDEDLPIQQLYDFESPAPRLDSRFQPVKRKGGASRWLEQYQGEKGKSQTGPKIDPSVINYMIQKNPALYEYMYQQSQPQDLGANIISANPGVDPNRSMISKSRPEPGFWDTAMEAFIDPVSYTMAALDPNRPEGQSIRQNAINKQNTITSFGTPIGTAKMAYNYFNPATWFGNPVSQINEFQRTGTLDAFTPAVMGAVGTGAVKGFKLKTKAEGGEPDDDAIPYRKTTIPMVEAGENIPEVARTQETESFSDAFRNARTSGLKTFTWRGKLYGTQYKTEVERKQGPSAEPKGQIAKTEAKKQAPLKSPVSMELRRSQYPQQKPSAPAPVRKSAPAPAPPAQRYTPGYGMTVTSPQGSRVAMPTVQPTVAAPGKKPAVVQTPAPAPRQNMNVPALNYGYLTAPASSTAVGRTPVPNLELKSINQPAGKTSVSKTLPTKGTQKPVTGQLQTQQPENIAADAKDQQINFMGNLLSQLNQKDQRQLPQTGVIIDKRTGQTYVKSGSDIYDYPVLTGKNVEGNVTGGSQYDPDTYIPWEFQTTPRGYYTLEDKRMIDGQEYGIEGKNYAGNAVRWMVPIDSYGMPASNAVYNAMHGTYLPQYASRNPRYTQPADKRWVSQGCVNARECDVKKTFNDIAVGDTSLVLDSKYPEDAVLLEMVKNQQAPYRTPLARNVKQKKKGGDTKSWIKNYE